MLITSITMAYDTITPEVLPTCVNGVLRDNNLAVLFASSERNQETETSIWDFGSNAGTHRINYCGSILGGAACTNDDYILPKRQVYTMEEEKLILDPSVMEVNAPYCLDVFGARIWAMKDDSDDVVFFELGE